MLHWNPVAGRRWFSSTRCFWCRKGRYWQTCTGLSLASPGGRCAAVWEGCKYLPGNKQDKYKQLLLGKPEFCYKLRYKCFVKSFRFLDDVGGEGGVNSLRTKNKEVSSRRRRIKAPKPRGTKETKKTKRNFGGSQNFMDNCYSSGE